MALTVTLDQRRAKRIGRGRKELTGTLTFSGTYSGGELATGISKYFKKCLAVLCDQTGGYIFLYDRTANKIKVFYPRSSVTDTLSVKTPALSHESGAQAVKSSAETMPNHAVADCTISGNPGVAAGAGEEFAGAITLSGVNFVASGY